MLDSALLKGMASVLLLMIVRKGDLYTMHIQV